MVQHIFLPNRSLSARVVGILCAFWWIIGGTSALTAQFTNVTAQAGINHKYSQSGSECAMMTGGAVAEDFDGDGWLDLFVLMGNGIPCRLYRNNADGTFVEEAALRGAALALDQVGACAADYDNDGDVDLVVTRCSSGPVLLTNDGAGFFTPDTDSLEFPFTRAWSPSFGDVDNDGLLDLAAGQWDIQEHNFVLFRNTGSGFVPVRFRDHVAYNDRWVFAPRFADVNNDSFTDLALACDFGNSQLYLNDGRGGFVRATAISGTGTEQNGMGTTLGDYDNDGDLDWFVTSIYDPVSRCGPDPCSGNRLYRNRGDGTFTDVTDAAGVRDGNWGWAASFGDLDNDGDLDLYHVNGWLMDLPRYGYQPARLFENQGDGTFLDTAQSSGADDRGQGRGVVLFDYDNDGDLDIFIANHNAPSAGVPPAQWPGGEPVLLRNDTVTANHWLRVTLKGQPPLHRHGIGSRVLVSAGGTRQLRELHASSNYLSQDPGRIAHFGLGSSLLAEEVRAEWVNGDATVLIQVPVDQALVVTSPQSVVSVREPTVGELVVADGTAVEPVNAWREWEIEGQTWLDPAQVSFGTPGRKELVLRLRAAPGGSVIRTEMLRIMVRDPDAEPSPTPTASPVPPSTPAGRCVCAATPQPGDQDGDSVPDLSEFHPADGVPATGSNRFLWDSDGDGLSDGEEDRNANGETDPNETDPRRRDSDGDGLTDWMEARLGFDPLERYNPGGPVVDSDVDGLHWGYDPDDRRNDIDGDRVRDGAEVSACGMAAALDSTRRPPFGDANCDGHTSNLDCLVIHAIHLGQRPHGVVPGEGNGDINLDGAATNTDALILARWFIGLTPLLPVAAPR